jgi:hypothetical protein
MIIELKKEIHVRQNDVYILEGINSEVLINNNYDGVLLLNKSLIISQQIDLFDDICIYQVFKRYH